MKKLLFGPLFVVMVCSLVFLSEALADPVTTPSDDPRYVLHVKKEIKKAKKIASTVLKAKKEKKRLLDKYGKITKQKQGRTIITVATPINQDDQNLLSPMHALVNPATVAEQVAELTELHTQLGFFLTNEQIEFTTSLHNMNKDLVQGTWEALTPPMVQDLVDQIEDALSDLATDTVDEVGEFFNDVFGW